MKTIAGKQGKITNMLLGAEAIEIKATIADAQIDNALTRLNLTVDNDEERYIYFFDTPGLDLLAAGIIARARRTVGDEHDSTIKFRPVVPEEVAKTGENTAASKSRPMPAKKESSNPHRLPCRSKRA